MIEFKLCFQVNLIFRTPYERHANLPYVSHVNRMISNSCVNDTQIREAHSIQHFKLLAEPFKLLISIWGNFPFNLTGIVF